MAKLVGLIVSEDEAFKGSTSGLCCGRSAISVSVLDERAGETRKPADLVIVERAGGRVVGDVASSAARSAQPGAGICAIATAAIPT